jgi:cyclohexanone monooxygenase
MRLLIVGSGFAGLCTAIKLAEDGETSYVVIERADDVGGTCRDHTDPAPGRSACGTTTCSGG